MFDDVKSSFFSAIDSVTEKASEIAQEVKKEVSEFASTVFESANDTSLPNTNEDVFSYVEEAETPDYKMEVLEGDNNELEYIQNEYVQAQEQNENQNCPSKFRDKERERNLGVVTLKGEQPCGADDAAQGCDTRLDESLVSSAISWVSDKIQSLNPFSNIYSMDKNQENVQDTPSDNFKVIETDENLDNDELNDLINYLKNDHIIQIEDDPYGMKAWAKLCEDSENIAKNIKSDLSFSLPIAGNKLKEHVKSINKDNIGLVMGALTELGIERKSLFAEILGNISIPFDDRAECCNHIMEELCKDIEYRFRVSNIYTKDLLEEFKHELNYQKNTLGFADTTRLDSILNKLKLRENASFTEKWKEGNGTEIINNIDANGKIDNDFAQGNTGDCWLLASIKALSLSPKGMEILNDSVKLHENGNITVTLKGVNKSYTFTKEELEGNIQLASGDLDIRAIERAVERYTTEDLRKQEIDGGHADSAFQILTGKGRVNQALFRNTNDNFLPEFFAHRNHVRKITTDDIDKFNNENYIAVIETGDERIYLGDDTDESNEKNYLAAHHAFTVSRTDDKNVYLINPWDSSKEIQIDRKIFSSFLDKIYIGDVEL